MSDLKHFIHLVETAQQKLIQEPLKFSKGDLYPVMSKETLDLHFSKLAKAYVDRYNKGEGDLEFNFNGATLHNIFFAQFSTSQKNRPFGASAELINNKYKSFDNFKSEFLKEAMSIQGSGWAYMDNVGAIKTFKNHDYRKGMKITLLVDWWEHAFVLDYGSDKEKYLNNLWKIVDWSIINDRLQG